jgi:hypothetical protein
MSIFGHSSIRIVKQPESLRWLVLTEEGTELVGVPWYLVYEFQQLMQKQGSRWIWDQNRREALDACMYIAPLTDADRQRLFSAYPQCSGKRPYYPRTDIWEGGSTDSSRQTPAELDTPSENMRKQDTQDPKGKKEFGEDEPIRPRKLML